MTIPGVSFIPELRSKWNHGKRDQSRGKGVGEWGQVEDKNEPDVKRIRFQKMQLNTHELNFVIKAMNKSPNRQKFEPWT